MLPARIDLADQIGQTQMMSPSNLLQSVPERIFEADAGLVTGDDDGPFDHRRFQQSCVHRNKPRPGCSRSVTRAENLRATAAASKESRKVAKITQNGFRSVQLLGRALIEKADCVNPSKSPKTAPVITQYTGPCAG